MGRFRKDTAVTFDMLRAFDNLAETLNLSETAEDLGTTRQTVRRHISNLEEFRGGPLFSLKKQSYCLTPLGKESLAGAKSILRQADSWCQGGRKSPSSSQHLDYAEFVNEQGCRFLSQQHPVCSVTRQGSALIQKGLSAWGQSLARIEAEAMAEVRPFLVIYRRGENGWVCVEVGDQATYTMWFGWTWAKSAVGRLSQDDQAGNEFNRFIADTYERIHGEGGVRLDHLFAHLPREISEGPVPITFERLLMACTFPDNTPALAVLVSVTLKVEIDGLTEEEKASVSPDLIAEMQTAKRN